MKRVLIYIAILFANSATIMAQEWDYNEIITFGLMGEESNRILENSETGYNAQVIACFDLHKKPLANRVKFAIEAGLETGFTRYQRENLEKNLLHFHGEAGENYFNANRGVLEDEAFTISNFRLGIKAGPAIIFRLNQKKDIYLNTYCHFTPSFNLFATREYATTGFIPYFSFGMKTVFFSQFGLGFEISQGKGRFKDIALGHSKEYLKDTVKGAEFIKNEKHTIENKSLKIYFIYML